MTRFARAKGSKASNERVPEEATSWSEMKEQLLEQNKAVEAGKKRHEAEKQRESNYKEFLNEVEEEKVRNTTWAEFPATKSKRQKELNDSDSSSKKKVKNTASGGKRKSNALGSESHKKLKLNEDDCDNVNKEIEETGEKVANKTKLQKKKKSKRREECAENNEESKTAENSDSFTSSSVNETNHNVNKPKKTKKMRKANISNDKAPMKKPDNKLTNGDGGNKAKKSKEELSEEDLKKLEKKKQKRMRQLDKKKLTLTTGTKKHPKHTEDKKPERRKKPQNTMVINGKEVEIAYVDGFPIKKEDAARIRDLRKQMISKSLPRSEIKIALKLERRKAEKAFAREKKNVCFNCRKSGHNLSECPELGKELAESSGTGICFKCGSTEHTHFECKVVRGQEFKFAQCFICHEQGHIARQCPDNARGLYPKGGACNVCGDVTHLKKDCPKHQAQQQQLQNVHAETITRSDNPDILDKSDAPTQLYKPKVNKIVKF